MNTEEKLRLRFNNNPKINLFYSCLQDLKPEELKLKLKDLLEDNPDSKFVLNESAKKTYERDFGSKGKLCGNVVATLTQSMGNGGGNCPVVDEKYFLKPEQVEKIMAKGSMRNRMMQKKDISGTLLSRDYKDPKCIELTQGVSQAQRIFSDEGSACTLRALGGGQGAKTGLYLIDPKTHKQYDEVTPCLRAGIGSGNKFQVAFNEPIILDLYNKKERTDYSIALTEPHHNNLRLGVGTRVRRLTPKECFRLQGFLQDEVNLDGLSDTQCYKLVGNGQSVNVVKLIFKELLKKS
jgi:site-specific DNA-cytosine methylase